MKKNVILLIEDEVELQKMLRDLLAGNGFEVIAAPNGDEALKMLEASGAHIDLLIVDVVLPDISGAELAETVRRLARPDLPVLFTSGHCEQDCQALGIRDVPNFLEKPYTRDTLLKKVRQILSAGL